MLLPNNFSLSLFESNGEYHISLDRAYQFDFAYLFGVVPTSRLKTV